MAASLNSRVGCVVLAAGAGRRFRGGPNKLVTPFRGKPLLQHAVDAATSSRAMACTVVAGANGSQILAHVDLRRCTIVCNPAWQAGLATSIRCGLAYHADDDACILLVADQPLVTASDIDRLIQEFSQSRNAIVALRAAGIWGTPILFPRDDFAALSRLRGDRGAKRYAQAQSKRLRFVPAIDARAFSDIDTRADYQKLLRK